MRSQLADRFRLAEDDVVVVAGRPGRSDDATKDDLRARLESFTSVRDPDDPSATYEALSIQYLAGDGEAVTDACYLDPGARDLDDLDSVRARARGGLTRGRPTDPSAAVVGMVAEEGAPHRRDAQRLPLARGLRQAIGDHVQHRGWCPRPQWLPITSERLVRPPRGFTPRATGRSRRCG